MWRLSALLALSNPGANAASPCTANNTRELTIFGPWKGGDALLVNYTGPFQNDRPPHIQVGAAELTKHKAGEVWCLTNCRAVGSNAIEYDVPGVYNAALAQAAHLTVFYGSGAASKVPTFCAPLAA
jgi:hypothetical protein